MPYVSVAGLDTNGGGVHVGVGAIVRPDERFEFGLGTEWRYTWDAYGPNHFALRAFYARALLGPSSVLPALFHRGMLGVSVAGSW